MLLRLPSVSDGHDGLQLLPLFVIPHALSPPRSCNEVVVCQVVRRAAVHNHREPVVVAGENPFDTASQQGLVNTSSLSK